MLLPLEPSNNCTLIDYVQHTKEKRTQCIPHWNVSVISCLEYNLIVTDDLLNAILVVLSANILSLRKCNYIEVLRRTMMTQGLTFVGFCNYLFIGIQYRICVMMTLSQVEQFLSNLPQSTTKLNLKTPT